MTVTVHACSRKGPYCHWQCQYDHVPSSGLAMPSIAYTIHHTRLPQTLNHPITKELATVIECPNKCKTFKCKTQGVAAPDPVNGLPTQRHESCMPKLLQAEQLHISLSSTMLQCMITFEFKPLTCHTGPPVRVFEWCPSTAHMCLSKPGQTHSAVSD